MTIVAKDGNNVSDLISDGSQWIITYRDADLSYVFHGQHSGQITGKDITIEYFDTEAEMQARITELGIIIPDEPSE